MSRDAKDDSQIASYRALGEPEVEHFGFHCAVRRAASAQLRVRSAVRWLDPRRPGLRWQSAVAWTATPRSADVRSRKRRDAIVDSCGAARSPPAGRPRKDRRVRIDGRSARARPAACPLPGRSAGRSVMPGAAWRPRLHRAFIHGQFTMPWCRRHPAPVGCALSMLGPVGTRSWSTLRTVIGRPSTLVPSGGQPSRRTTATVCPRCDAGDWRRGGPW